MTRFRFLFIIAFIICFESFCAAQIYDSSLRYQKNNTSGCVHFKSINQFDDLSLSEQLTEENTIYEFKGVFDLNNKVLTIPHNCVLLFDGGVIKNGTIVGNNTQINASASKIFELDVIFHGTWAVNEFIVEWLGAKADGLFDNTEVLRRLFTTPFYNIKFSTGIYLVTGPVVINPEETTNNKLLRIQGSNDFSIDNNGTIIKTASKEPIFSISKPTYQLRLHDIHFCTTVEDGIAIDFDKSLSEFHFSHLKFTGPFSEAIRIKGSIGTIEQCYFSEEVSTTWGWKDVVKNRYAINLSGSQISINNCNFWRVRTAIKMNKVISCSIYNNWFESNLHYDILFGAYTLCENVNIYGNSFVNVGFVNGKRFDYYSSAIKFDGNKSLSTFFCRTINIYSNYCWNEANTHFIDFDWNKNKGKDSSFSNIHIFNNDIDGNISHLFYASPGATALDVVFYGNSVRDSALIYNDQLGRQYRCIDTPKYGNTSKRKNYKYWSKGDTYYDSDLNKLLVFIGKMENAVWVDSNGNKY